MKEKRYKYMELFSENHQDFGICVDLHENPVLKEFGYNCKFWDYKSLTHKDIEESLNNQKYFPQLEDVLNTLGENGWRVVHIIPVSILIEKKPNTDNLYVRHRQKEIWLEKEI